MRVSGFESQLNGQQGVVTSLKSGKVRVLLDGSAKPVPIKPCNLQPVSLVAGGPAGAMSEQPAALQLPDRERLERNAVAMRQMDSATMIARAQAMRAMGPAAVRARVPGFAQLDDAQLEDALKQLEAMATDPALRNQVAQQIESLARPGGAPAQEPPAPPNAYEEAYDEYAKTQENEELEATEA